MVSLYDVPRKEYYSDEGVLDQFQNVIEILLYVLTESEGSEKTVQTKPTFVVVNEDANVWPPWPWPPWGDDDDDPDMPKDPTDRRRRAHRLAKQVVRLERRLAKASLDL